MQTKHTVLEENLDAWLACRGDRAKRGALARTLATSIKMHIKSISRAMKALQLKDTCIQKRRGRAMLYGKDVDAALYAVWDIMGRPCADILHPMRATYAQAFKALRQWHYSDVTTEQFCVMSLGTIKRRVGALREKHDTVRGKSATVSSPLKGMIPIRKSHTWTDLPPGYSQIDTVVHCGDLLSADVIYSLGDVDFATYWTEYTAQWGKGQEATWQSFDVVSERSPIKKIEAHPDTGNEFINYHFHRQALLRGIALTRSEPYKKNDNMCIEERNDNIPRRYLGYARLDDIAMLPLAQEILRVACLWHNHFMPVKRMISKVRIGAKWKRTFEKVAKTPYERVMAHNAIPEETKTKLRVQHEALNPITLKRELDALQASLERMVRERNK